MTDRRAEGDTKQLARTLHDANLSLRESRLEIRVLSAAVGALCGWTFHPWWVGPIVMVGIFVVAISSAAFFAQRWMRKQNLDWEFGPTDDLCLSARMEPPDDMPILCQLSKGHSGKHFVRFGERACQW